MKIACSRSVAYGREAFETLGEVDLLSPQEITAERLRDTDALIIRSTTRVDEDLLAGTRLAYVGTATAGTDHLDIPALEAREIVWSAAPGCNATSVAEFVTASLLTLADEHGLDLPGKTLGIVGVGQVGRRVADQASALGLHTLLNDPPRSVAEGREGFTELPALLAQADFVSLHVPLTTRGPFPTHHLADHRFFEDLRPGALFLNTARGEVVDPDALTLALDRGRVRLAALDVWPGEPAIDPALVRRVHLATPHIAGYADEARLAGTWQIYRDLCLFLEADPVWTPPAPDPLPPPLDVSDATQDPEWALRQAVRSACDVRACDRELRAILSAPDIPGAFRHLRQHQAPRHEFAQHRLRLPPGSLRQTLERLGFRTESP